MRVNKDWLLTSQRAAIHVPTATAVIADLHLGYDEARRRAGEAVPEATLDEVTAALGSLLVVYGTQRLVVAGDLFETGRSAPLAEELLDWLRAARMELVAVVPGNHDRGLKPGDDRLPVYGEGFSLGAWRVVHGDAELPRYPVVQGHCHPCLRWGTGIAAPCYLIAARHIILPAFSADAAGVNVLRDPRWRSYRCCAIAGDAVLDFGEVVALHKARSEW